MTKDSIATLAAIAALADSVSVRRNAKPDLLPGKRMPVKKWKKRKSRTKMQKQSRRANY